ncbi:MAG TPA: hypothetical protein VG845_13750, partial [Dehalococcoidia bacterium]|nr:hypothetical protein [Dehalococcoidia bacterium]
GMLIYFISRPKDRVDSFGYRGSYAYPYGAPQYRPEYERASGPSVPNSSEMESIERLHQDGTLNDDEYNDLRQRMSDQKKGVA